MESARCAWEVTAGIVPGTPEPEFTKRWGMTSSEWHDVPREQAKTRFEELEAEAERYAHDLREPARLNWVRLDWVWF